MDGASGVTGWSYRRGVVEVIPRERGRRSTVRLPTKAIRSPSASTPACCS